MSLKPLDPELYSRGSYSQLANHFRVPVPKAADENNPLFYADVLPRILHGGATIHSRLGYVAVTQDYERHPGVTRPEERTMLGLPQGHELSWSDTKGVFIDLTQGEHCDVLDLGNPDNHVSAGPMEAIDLTDDPIRNGNDVPGGPKPQGLREVYHANLRNHERCEEVRRGLDTISPGLATAEAAIDNIPERGDYVVRQPLTPAALVYEGLVATNNPALSPKQALEDTMDPWLHREEHSQPRATPFDIPEFSQIPGEPQDRLGPVFLVDDNGLPVDSDGNPLTLSEVHDEGAKRVKRLKLMDPEVDVVNQPVHILFPGPLPSRYTPMPAQGEPLQRDLVDDEHRSVGSIPDSHASDTRLPMTPEEAEIRCLLYDLLTALDPEPTDSPAS